MDIGIIGGADGPTAIFIASPWITWGLVTGAIIVISAVVFVIWRNRKARNSSGS